MLVMRIIVSFGAVFGLFMVEEQPAWRYVFQPNYKMRDWNENSEASHVVYSSHAANCRDGPLEGGRRREAPMGPNIFLGWVKIHLPWGLIHSLHGWEEVSFQLVDNQAFPARAKHLTILAIILDEYEQMVNILSWFIDTFLLFRLEPNWNWAQGVWNCRSTANSKFPCTGFVLYSHTSWMQSPIWNAIIE